MSLEDNEQMDWHSIMERNRQGTTRNCDADWLEQYHNQWIAEKEQLKAENEEMRQIIEKMLWQFYG